MTSVTNTQSFSAFQHCPVCGSASVMRLVPEWQDGRPIPIVGCGNPWHYDQPVDDANGLPHRGAPGGVHNHGTESGKGVGCPEYLIGECMLAEARDATGLADNEPKGKPVRSSPSLREALEHLLDSSVEVEVRAQTPEGDDAFVHAMTFEAVDRARAALAAAPPEPRWPSDEVAVEQLAEALYSYLPGPSREQNWQYWQRRAITLLADLTKGGQS